MTPSRLAQLGFGSESDSQQGSQRSGKESIKKAKSAASESFSELKPLMIQDFN